VDCFGGIQFGGDGQTIFMDGRLSEIWWELAPHYFPADYFRINFFSESLSKSIRKVSITATCRLEWHYQLSKKIMAFSSSNIETE
jgi:hypothetical protein